MHRAKSSPRSRSTKPDAPVPRQGEGQSEGKAAGGSARRKALDLLARREHSLAELREKLRARDFAAEEIETTLEQLAREGLASDQRFVEAFVAAQVRKGQGPVRIRAELQRRGIGGEASAPHLDADLHDWPALARAVRAKRFGGGAPKDFHERARQARFLEFRGFSMDHIRAALGADE